MELACESGSVHIQIFTLQDSYAQLNLIKGKIADTRSIKTNSLELISYCGHVHVHGYTGTLLGVINI